MLEVDYQCGPLTHVFMHLPPSGFSLRKKPLGSGCFVYRDRPSVLN